MFNYLITVQSLGFLYGSAGAFLSPENLVGRSGTKFPPDAATLSGLFFSANKVNPFILHETLRENLYIAGPFWAEIDRLQSFYVPIPWTKIISDKETAEWTILGDQWNKKSKQDDLKPDYKWQQINQWDKPANTLKSNQKDTGSIAKTPWEFVSMLHPKIQNTERCVEGEDGLFLENAVQMNEESCLVYLSTHKLPDGWYRFGGENHLVEVTSHELPPNIRQKLEQPIERAFALITPAVWGSNRLSCRYPQHPDFPKPQLMLTDKPIPYRFRIGKVGEQKTELLEEENAKTGRLGRGRYAVPSGSVYVLSESLNKPWWEWPEDWFPNEGFSLKRVGCGLCLPLSIEGVE